MKLKIALDDKLMDVRLRDRHLGDGKISKSDLDSFLTALPSEEGNYEKVEDKEVAVEEITE